MLMVAEMTGSLSIVVPTMVAVGLATLIVRRNDDTIYRSQLKSRAESPRTESSPASHYSPPSLYPRRWQPRAVRSPHR